MRGPVVRQTEMWSTVSTEDLVPADHPIRRIKPVVDAILVRLEPTFAQMYSTIGRPSIPPELLLKATVLMAMYSLRSERQFCERLRYDMLFRWFLDLNIDDDCFVATTFTKNRDRLLTHRVADEFFQASVAEARLRRYVSDDHFTADGSLLEAWASTKSFRPIDDTPDDEESGRSGGGRNREVDFHGETRSNVTHRSRTDPEARLIRKGRGQPARMQYAHHVLMENRSGLIVETELTVATGRAERDTAIELLQRLPAAGRRRRTLGADKGYDTTEFVAACRQLNVTPHVTQNVSGRRSAIDGRTTSWPGYARSQRVRKRVEEIFGWQKTVGGCRKLRFVGRARNRIWTLLSAATFNLTRITNLDHQAAQAAT
jgi:transposase